MVVVVVEAAEEEIITILGITQDNSPTTAPWRETTLEEETQDLTEVQKIQYTASKVKPLRVSLIMCYDCYI